MPRYVGLRSTSFCDRELTNLCPVLQNRCYRLTLDPQWPSFIQDLTTATGSTAGRNRRREQTVYESPPPPPPSHECTFTELPNWDDNPRKQFDVNSAPLWPYPESLPLRSGGQILGTQTWEECLELCQQTPGCVYVYRPSACFKPGYTADSSLRTKWTGGDPRYNFANMCFMYNNYEPMTGTQAPPPPPPPPPPAVLPLEAWQAHLCYNGVNQYNLNGAVDTTDVLDSSKIGFGAYNYYTIASCKSQDVGGCCGSYDYYCSSFGTDCGTCAIACDQSWAEYKGACIDARSRITASIPTEALAHTSETECINSCCQPHVCAALGETHDQCVYCKAGCTTHYTALPPPPPGVISAQVTNAPPGPPPYPLSPGGESQHWMSDEWCPGTITASYKGLGDPYRHAYSSCHDSTFGYQTHTFGHADEATTGIAVTDLNRDGFYDVVRSARSSVLGVSKGS